MILRLLPLTGDEAYFIKWGEHLAMGYYDHPPMVGWLVHLMGFISNDIFVYRLFSFFTLLVVAYMIYRILLLLDTKREDAEYSALLFVLLPVDILISLFTNDIPLLLFGTLGSYFMIKSLKTHWLFNAVLAGVFFGAAFLSKYFALFLMLGLLLYILYEYKLKYIKSIAVAAVIVLFFVLQNLYFNYNSCWNNILFNFFARTENAHFTLKYVVVYFVMIAYIMTPFGLYYLMKSHYSSRKLLRFVMFSMGVGLTIFFIVSFRNKVGLHWLLLFVPYAFMLFVFVHENYRDKLARYGTYFTYFHIVLLIILLLLPVELFKNHRQYGSVLLGTKPNLVCQNIEKYDPIYTTGYTSASMLSYYCRRDIKMILNNSKYGRLDDKLVDVRKLQDQKIYIFYKKKPNLEILKQLFEKAKVETFAIDGYSFYVVEAEYLKYPEYKKRYLDIQKKRFYAIPKWLPAGKCYFFDKYYREDSEESR